MLTDSKLLTSAAWDAQSLNELKTKAGKDPAANIRPVARQVEGMFVQMMLKSMRETLPKDGMFSSDSTRLYTSMYDQQIAQQMTAGKGLGLADMIVKQTEAAQGIQPQDQPPCRKPRAAAMSRSPVTAKTSWRSFLYLRVLPANRAACRIT